MNPLLDRDKMLDWLKALKLQMKAGDVTNAYVKVCQAIERLENK